MKTNSKIFEGETPPVDPDGGKTPPPKT